MNGTICMMPVSLGPSLCPDQGPDGRPVSGVLAQVTQYVTAYRVDPDRLTALLPPGYRSLRPVLRLNVEVLDQVKWLNNGSLTRVELVTPVEYPGKKGWLNLVTWEDDVDSVLVGREIYGIPKRYAELTVQTQGPAFHLQAKRRGFCFLEMTFHRVGVEGGCPAEADNEGNFYPRYLPAIQDRTAAAVDETVFTPVEAIDGKKEYCDCTFQWHQADETQLPVGFPITQAIGGVPCIEVLGAYAVHFARTKRIGEQQLL